MPNTFIPLHQAIRETFNAVMEQMAADAMKAMAGVMRDAEQVSEELPARLSGFGEHLAPTAGQALKDGTISFYEDESATFYKPVRRGSE